MGLKLNDSCLLKVAEDEPIFVLRAQDKLAPDIVRQWAFTAAGNGCPAEKVKEAGDTANRMEAWQEEHGCKTPD